MSGDATLNLILALGFLVLVASALLAQRPSARDVLRGVLQWAMVFLVLFVLFAYRDEANQMWQRVVTELGPDRTEVVGGTLRIRPQDGHFFVNAKVNGRELRFLIDTGATLTALGSEDATDLGVVPSQYGFPVVIQTANGTISARRAAIDRLVVGPIERANFAVIVSPSFGGLNVLGMNFLNSLSSWRVEQGVMILEG